MQKTQTIKIKKIKNLLLVSILLIVSLTMLSTANAEDVPVDASAVDPDCFWSSGPGSELYVPDGKTCTLKGSGVLAPSANEDATGFTDYAVIVYPGGTLNIVYDDSQGTSTDFTVTGNVLNMGTIKIGVDDPTPQNNIFSTTATITGDVTVLGDSGELLTVPNLGTGYNTIIVNGITNVGDISGGGQIILSDDNSNYDFGHIESYDKFDINNGTVTASSIFVHDPNTLTSIFTIAQGATLTLDSYTTCDSNTCPFSVGTLGNSGNAELIVSGTLNASPTGTPAVPVLYTIGAKGTMTVEDNGIVNIDILGTTTFGTPPYTNPDTAILMVGSELFVKGAFNSGVFFMNLGGSIDVNKDGGLSAATMTIKDYFQGLFFAAPELNVAAGDTLTIGGTADIESIGSIAGTLAVEDCTKIHNATAEEFRVTSTGTFSTNTLGAGSCDLSNTSALDGLNVQGANSLFTIDNGADINIKDDFRIDDYGNVDANGFFEATGDLIMAEGAVASLQDTDALDTFKSNDLYVQAATVGDAILTLEGSSIYALQGGSVNIGTAGTGGTGTVKIYGDLNVPISSSDNFTIGNKGTLEIFAGGTVNADAGSGLFHINGGEVTIEGISGNPGTLNLADQKLQMDNATTVASLKVGTGIPPDATNGFGVITSNATPGIGFAYNEGVLDMHENSIATFDDVIEISTNDAMLIGGFLRGTDDVIIGCDKGTSNICKVEPSGEIKVVDGPDALSESLIFIIKEFDLLGKLNGDNGAGDVSLHASGPGNITSIGTASESSYAYILANDLDIADGTYIDVSNFQNCYNPGGTPTYGGSYGGQGAGGNTDTFGSPKHLTAPIYPGTPNPVGMCGFDGSGGKTMNGGGAIYIKVHNDLDLHNTGEIRANGENSTTALEGGAGSGGLIVINHAITHADTGADFIGAATTKINANGGNGYGTSTSYGGGGGRIVIDSIQFDIPDDDETGEPHYQFAGGIKAIGGTTNNGTTDYAAAGTIVLLGDDNNPDGNLIVDQNNNTLEIFTKTDIAPLGVSSADYTFSRLYAANGAHVDHNAGPPDRFPVSCYEVNGGYVAGTNCNPNPDKPDTLHINDSVAGTLTGEEPWTDTGGTYPPNPVAITTTDADPVFSIIARNPEDTDPVNQLWIQVTTDLTFTTITHWNESNLVLDDWISLGNPRTSVHEFEYAGNPLSPSTTYYVRIAYWNNIGSDVGLWNHMDMGNEYKFTTGASYFDISNNCNDVLKITQTGLPAGANVNIASGRRYGFGECDFTIDSSTIGDWEVQYGMAPGTTGFSDASATYTLTPIDNAGSDYTINSIITNNVEEYGFNIDETLTPGGLTSSNVMGDGTYNFNTSNKFNIEANGAEDPILQDISSAPVSDDFSLKTYLHVADTTFAEDYFLNTWMILTQGP